MLNEVGGTLGGETSGHILCLDKTTTGDGLVSALQVLGVMKQTGRRARRTERRHAQVSPGAAQRAGRPALRSSAGARGGRVVQAVERRFEGRGRIVLRASGTEPVIRVMVEGYDAGLVKQAARDIAAVVEAAAAGAARRRRPGPLRLAVSRPRG